MERVRTNKLVCSEWVAWVAVGVAAVASFVAVGCGGDDSDGTKETPPGDPATEPLEGCDAIDLKAPKRGEGMQVSIDMTLEPGQERQICRLVLVKDAVNLNWAEGVFTRGSHHGLVARTMYRDQLPTENIRGEAVADASQVATCESIGSDWDTNSVIAGGHALGASSHTEPMTKGVLPDDVAVKIAAGEVLIVNFHMLNATEKTIHGCYKQNLYGIPDEQVKTEAGHMFYYNAFITVPARQRASAKMACPVSSDVTLAAQVSHMHKRGMGYKATLLDGDPLAGGKAIETLYDGSEWDEPIARVNSPALELKAGQWIQWQCDYLNDEDVNVSQGQETTDEMCMFRGTYWPRSDAMDWCMASGSTDWYSAARPLTSGTMNGQQFVDCYTSSPQVFGGGGPKSAADRFASQSCITQTCEKVGGHLNEFGAAPGELDPTTLGCE